MVRIGRWVDVKMQKMLSSAEISQRRTNLREKAKKIDTTIANSLLKLITDFQHILNDSKQYPTTLLAIDMSGFRLEAQISLTQNTRRPNTQLMRYILILPFYFTHLKTLHF